LTGDGIGLALSPATTAAAAADAALRQSTSAAVVAFAAVLLLPSQLHAGLGLCGALVVWMVAGLVAWLLLSSLQGTAAVPEEAQSVLP
jgi:diacylglycerol kinase